MGNLSDNDERMANGTELLELAEEFDDARQEAEAADAQATLEKLSVETLKQEKSEEQKRREHEEAEAKRKAEWEAKKKAKEEEELFKWETALAYDDNTIIERASSSVGKQAERLTRRNMKECITEMLQASCYDDIALARQVHHPRKSLANCFRYINRKALDFVKQELKDNGIKLNNEVYGSDVPDDLCYQWAIDYFFDMDAPEDKPDDEEQFIPKPYYPQTSTSKTKKKVEKKKPEPKKETPKSKALESEGQMDMFSMLGGETAA